MDITNMFDKKPLMLKGLLIIIIVWECPVSWNDVLQQKIEQYLPNLYNFLSMTKRRRLSWTPFWITNHCTTFKPYIPPGDDPQACL